MKKLGYAVGEMDKEEFEEMIEQETECKLSPENYMQIISRLQITVKEK